MKNRLFYRIFVTYVIIIVLAMAVVAFMVGRPVKARMM
jgi:preprotein translocase subunit YajC